MIQWATSIINTECAEYEVGKKNGYFLNKGKTIKWWHGRGSFIDFFNPDAKKWWVSLMDRVINMGFDGWKCDGTDPLIALLRPWAYSSHKKRYILYHEYAYEYYGTFYNYTKSKNPDALIMSRPVDGYNNKLFLPYSPKYVMFSGWVGDQHNDV
jgi:alpha-glucosidase (family GH31 glycosyl hydrolase)